MINPVMFSLTADNHMYWKNEIAVLFIYNMMNMSQHILHTSSASLQLFSCIKPSAVGLSLLYPYIP